MKTYDVFLASYNSEDTIEKTIDSIFNQTIKPNNVFVFDDGSNDSTTSILYVLGLKYRNLHCIFDVEKHDYLTSRLPHNLNQLLNYAEKLGLRNTDYEVILASDIELSNDYCQKLLEYLEVNEDVAIISGNEETKYNYHSPRGAGRFILSSFFKNCCLSGRFTEDLTFESILIFEAMRLGYRKEILNEIKFKHLQESGSKHGFRSYGRAMKQLRYAKSYVFFRLLRNLFTGQEFARRFTLRVLMEYIKEKPSESLYPKELTDFIISYQKKRILGYLIHR